MKILFIVYFIGVFIGGMVGYIVTFAFCRKKETTGKWELIEYRQNDASTESGNFRGDWRGSCCGSRQRNKYKAELPAYCPECGAKMEETK